MAEDWRTAYGRVKMELEEYKETIVPALMDKIEELEQRWIPVTERLPENGQVVIVCDIRENWTGCWEYRYGGEWADNYLTFSTSDITHWMPIPEPPRENVDRHIETECANK